MVGETLARVTVKHDAVNLGSVPISHAKVCYGHHNINLK